MDLTELPAQAFTRHPWEEARVRFFAKVLRRYIAESDTDTSVLDVGGGDGYFAQNITSQLPCPVEVACWDVNYSDEFIAARENDTLAYTQSRPDRVFDALLLMDVLEHVEDDVEFLASLVRDNLRINGIVLLSVPAWQILFSNHDHKLLHHRRYSPKLCRQVMSESGLEILACGGLFHALLLPRIVQKIRESLFDGDKVGPLPDLGNWNRGKIFTFVVDRVLAIDNFVSYLTYRSNISLPGLSFWAVARKGEQ